MARAAGAAGTVAGICVEPGLHRHGRRGRERARPAAARRGRGRDRSSASATGAASCAGRTPTAHGSCSSSTGPGRLVALTPSFASEPGAVLASLAHANEECWTAAVTEDGEQMTALAADLEQSALLDPASGAGGRAGVVALATQVEVFADAAAFEASRASLLDPDREDPRRAARALRPARVVLAASDGRRSRSSPYGMFADASQASARRSAERHRAALAHVPQLADRAAAFHVARVRCRRLRGRRVPLAAADHPEPPRRRARSSPAPCTSSSRWRRCPRPRRPRGGACDCRGSGRLQHTSRAAREPTDGGRPSGPHALVDVRPSGVGARTTLVSGPSRSALVTGQRTVQDRLGLPLVPEGTEPLNPKLVVARAARLPL